MHMGSITSAIKKSVHKSFNLFGFDLIKHGHFDQSFGEHLLRVFSSRQIDCVFDVGANVGQYGRFLRNIGYTGHIVSFEPVKSAFEQLLRQSKNDAKWICLNTALSDAAGEKSINVFAETQFCSFLEASDYAKGTWTDVKDSTAEIVDTVRLDDVFESIKARTQCNNYYLKLDTQGYDNHVFRGAARSLRFVQAMQSELSLISVYEGMDRSFAGIEHYQDAGFFISGMYPINVEQSLAVIEYDCVLVKRDV
jgi:FkbM family methyltransferase